MPNVRILIFSFFGMLVEIECQSCWRRVRVVVVKPVIDPGGLAIIQAHSEKDVSEWTKVETPAYDSENRATNATFQANIVAQLSKGRILRAAFFR